MATSATWNQAQWNDAKNFLSANDLSTDAGKKATFQRAQELGFGSDETASILNKTMGGTYTGSGITEYGNQQGFGALDSSNVVSNLTSKLAAGYNSGGNFGAAYDYAKAQGMGADEVSGFINAQAPGQTDMSGVDAWTRSMGLQDLRRKRPVIAAQSAAATGMPSMAPAPIQSASSWNVAPNQTVANQLETILKSDGPLMQQARTRAMQQMQARGGLNTSMAASAGESALYDVAMPIATQDARTFASAGQFNTSEANVFGRDSNQFSRQQEMANFNLAANEWAAQQAQVRNMALRGADNAFTASRDTAQNQFTAGRDTAQNQFTAGRDTAQNQFTAGRDAANVKAEADRTNMAAINQARSNYATTLANVSASTTMDSAIKKETLTNLATTYNTMIDNYAKLLNWEPVSWRISTADIGGPATPAAPAVAAVAQDTSSGGGA